MCSVCSEKLIRLNILILGDFRIKHKGRITSFIETYLAVNSKVSILDLVQLEDDLEVQYYYISAFFVHNH